MVFVVMLKEYGVNGSIRFTLTSVRFDNSKAIICGISFGINMEIIFSDS